MFVVNLEAERDHTPRRDTLFEDALLALGAAYDYEDVAQAIADGARRLTDVAVVTLAVPDAEGSGVSLATSDASGAVADSDLLPTRTLSLVDDGKDGAPPLLRFHDAMVAVKMLPDDALRRFLMHARLALARAERLAEMTRLAYTDPLTGLANARGLQIALTTAVAVANAGIQPLALLIIDLDDFRRYNALWGHLVGDAALQAFARAIRAATEGDDFVARVGGEEFAVLLPDTGETEARIVAAQLHAAIARESDGLPSPFTASIGIGLYPNDVPDAFSLYAVADTAMTMAKRAGKNRTFLFEAIEHLAL